MIDPPWPLAPVPPASTTDAVGALHSPLRGTDRATEWRVRGGPRAATHDGRRGRTKNLSDDDRGRVQFSLLAPTARIDAMAKAAPRWLMRAVYGRASGRMTVVKHAIPRPVPRGKAEETAGRGGALGGDVTPRQAVEATTDERIRHWPPVTRVTRGTATATPTAFNKSEAVGVDSRTGARWRRRCPMPRAKALMRRDSLLRQLPKAVT